jgi:hypothetical protein
VQGAVTYTAIDAGAIAAARIAAQHARSPLRLQMGTIEPSVPRDRAYDAGASETDAIADLAAASSGFGFTVDPVAGVAGIFAALNVYYPAARDDQEDVRFEYGDGTLANLDGFREELRLPRNAIRATGAPDPTGVRTVRTAQDAASIARFDLWDAELALNEETNATVLQQRADGAVTGSPIAAYTVTPNADAPLLFRDFDAGDTVRLTLRRGAVDVAGTFRVSEATLRLTNEGTAELASLVVSSPNVNRVIRNPEDRLFDLLGAHGRRLAVLERAPLRGR